MLLFACSAMCTIDDLVNGITMPALPLAEIFINMSKPYVIEAVKGIVEEKYKTHPLISVPREPLPAYLTPKFAPSLERIDDKYKAHEVINT